MVNSRCLIFVSLFILSFPFSVLAGYYQRLVIHPNGTAYFSIYNLGSADEEGLTNIYQYDSLSNFLLLNKTIQDNDKCIILDLVIDPTFNKIAYNGRCNIPGADGEKIANMYHFLSILDLKTKKKIITFNNGFLFSFSPQGNVIVYSEEIPGEPGSPAPPGYQGGIWLYNFDTKTKIKIDTNPISPYGVRDINWSEHDGNIYFASYLGKSMRYNFQKGKSEPSPYKGIYFSPDGKYTVYTPIEGNARIFRTTDNKVVTEWEKQILEQDQSQHPQMTFKLWSKKLNAGIFTIHGKNVIFDVNKGKIIGSFGGWIVGTNNDGSLVAVQRGGTNKKIGQVEILNLLDLIQK